MQYNTNTDPLGHFVVIEDGAFSEARAEQHDHDVRSAMLRVKAREIGREMLCGGYTAAKAIGTFMLDLCEAAAEAGKQTA